METVAGVLTGVLGAAVLGLLVLVAYIAHRIAASDAEKSDLVSKLGDKVLATADVQLDRMRLENERDRIADGAGLRSHGPQLGTEEANSQLNTTDGLPPGFP